ncbi:MAG: hypothetical protein EB127_26050, partial [Alphaproteobacteria bacterium]|nr:hypothetical protein [Alphaproteobacteria bacterium]
TTSSIDELKLTKEKKTPISVLISKEYQQYLGPSSAWPSDVYLQTWDLAIQYQDLSLIRHITKTQTEELSSRIRKKISRDCLHLIHRTFNEDRLQEVIKMVFGWITNDFCIENNEHLLLALIEKLQYDPKKDNLDSVITYLPRILCGKEGMQYAISGKKLWESAVRHCLKDVPFEAYIQERNFFLIPQKNTVLDNTLHQLFTRLAFELLKDLSIETPLEESFDKLVIFNQHLLSNEFNAARVKPEVKIAIQIRLKSLLARFEFGRYHTTLKSAHVEHFVLFAEIVLHLSQNDAVKLHEATGWISSYLESLCFQEYIENTGFFLVTANTWLTYKVFKNIFIKFSQPLLEYLSDIALIEEDTSHHIKAMNTLLMQEEITVPGPGIEKLSVITENLNHKCKTYLQSTESTGNELKYIACLAATYFCLAEKTSLKGEGEILSLKIHLYEEWKNISLALIRRYEETKNPELLNGLIEIGRVWHLHNKPNPIDRLM